MKHSSHNGDTIEPLSLNGDTSESLSPNGDTSETLSHYVVASEPMHVQNAGHTPNINEDPDTKCGIGGFQPRCLQVFARIGAFIGLYSISNLLISVLAVYVNSQVTMLEKQFGFSSAETGLLMSCNDIGFLSCVIFAGYIARKVHIPRGLGISTMLYGICGIMCALPYFIQDRSMYSVGPSSSGPQTNESTPTRNFADRQVPMCLSINDTNVTEDGFCSEKNSEGVAYDVEQLWIKKVAFWLIAIGMVFQGIGKSPRTPFVTLYVDDAVDKRKTGFYMGILTGTGIFGPALGYLLGGLFSKIYVTLEDVDITPSDPRWIGAWWLGFIVFGSCSIVFSLPVICFPRKLRSRKRQNDVELTKSINTQSKSSTNNYVVHEIKGFLCSVLRLLRNPVFVLLTMSNIFNLIGVAGVLAFLPKYFATQYTIPLWHANIVMAVSNITAVSIGAFLGGVLTRKIDMTPQRTAKLFIVFYCMNIACSSSGFFLGCDQPALLGDNAKGEHSTLYQSPDISCLDGCSCSDEKYFPVCGDGNSYFSPCHAGCSIKEKIIFSNCTCISSGRAMAGLCDQDCSTKLYTYAFMAFIGRVSLACKIVPSFIAVIRSVKENDRAVAIAFGSFLYSVTGWMPGPVIFGMVIDGTCSLWDFTCGKRQSCQLYDIVDFRNAVHAYSTIATTCGGLVIICVYVLLKSKGYTAWNQISGEKLDRNRTEK